VLNLVSHLELCRRANAIEDHHPWSDGDPRVTIANIGSPLVVSEAEFDPDLLAVLVVPGKL
jgi:hypothetical protein